MIVFFISSPLVLALLFPLLFNTLQSYLCMSDLYGIYHFSFEPAGKFLFEL